MLSLFLEFLFLIIVFFITRQYPFIDKMYIMNISLFFFMLLNLKYLFKVKKSKLILLYLTISLNIILLFISISLGNDIKLALRFFVILNLIPVSFFLKPNRNYIKIFLSLMVLHSLILIGLEIYFILKVDPNNYSEIRNFFKNNNFGDVYTFNKKTWKIQIPGSSLLPVALSFIYLEINKHRNKLLFLTAIAVIIAGNFAFIVGILLFIFLEKIYINKPTIKKMNCYFIVIILLATVTFPKLKKIYIMKSERSNVIRIEQAEALMENLNETVEGIILGKGLGNRFEVVKEFRTYGQGNYYELQVLYFLNQMGYIMFFAYCTLHIILSKIFFKSNESKSIYISYLFYAFFNPYILDTNQIVVIILLISYENKRSKSENHRYINNV